MMRSPSVCLSFVFLYYSILVILGAPASKDKQGGNEVSLRAESESETAEDECSTIRHLDEEEVTKELINAVGEDKFHLLRHSFEEWSQRTPRAHEDDDDDDDEDGDYDDNYNDMDEENYQEGEGTSNDNDDDDDDNNNNNDASDDSDEADDAISHWNPVSAFQKTPLSREENDKLTSVLRNVKKMLECEKKKEGKNDDDDEDDDDEESLEKRQKGGRGPGGRRPGGRRPGGRGPGGRRPGGGGAGGRRPGGGGPGGRRPGKRPGGRKPKPGGRRPRPGRPGYQEAPAALLTPGLEHKFEQALDLAIIWMESQLKKEGVPVPTTTTTTTPLPEDAPLNEYDYGY